MLWPLPICSRSLRFSLSDAISAKFISSSVYLYLLFPLLQLLFNKYPLFSSFRSELRSHFHGFSENFIWYVVLAFCSKSHSTYHCVYFLECTWHKYSFIFLALSIRFQTPWEQGPCLPCSRLHSQFWKTTWCVERGRLTWTNGPYVNHNVVKSFHKYPQSLHLRINAEWVIDFVLPFTLIPPLTFT